MPPEFPPYDLYEELGLSPRASGRLIEAAYRAMAKECHPDTAVDRTTAEARMKRVNAAHDVLADPVQRALYDEWRAALAHTARTRDDVPTGRQPPARRQPNQCPICNRAYRTVAGLQWHRAIVEECQ